MKLTRELAAEKWQSNSTYSLTKGAPAPFFMPLNLSEADKTSITSSVALKKV